MGIVTLRGADRSLPSGGAGLLEGFARVFLKREGIAIEHARQTLPATLIRTASGPRSPLSAGHSDWRPAAPAPVERPPTGYRVFVVERLPMAKDRAGECTLQGTYCQSFPVLFRSFRVSRLFLA